MGHVGTDQETFDRVVKFSSGKNMITIPLNKEQSGYVLNPLLVSLLSAAENF